ncbi:hypothetical protein [Streptomyces sp. NPDC057382]|uniref:hypothetical protein n=1 Tax=unclassified Streptomyces TaxID=2593676 RepID=UPI0036305690
MKTRGMLGAAGAAVVGGVPVAAWGLMGRQDYDGLPADELDYAFQPWDVGDGVAAGVGGIGLLVAVAGAVVLARGARRGAMDPRWWSVVGPLVVVGLMAGAGWRILTAGVVGANIGARLVIILGAPVAAALVVWALARSVWLVAGRRGRGGGRGRVASHGV